METLVKAHRQTNMVSSRQKGSRNNGNRNSVLENYHIVLGHLNKRKLFIVDQVPRFLVSQFNLMPRNYLSNDNVCDVRYSQSTNYPWGMMTVAENPQGGGSRIDYFPMFTPVVPAPIAYSERDYDQTEVFIHNSNDPVAIAEQQQRRQQELLKRQQQIPAANDYENSIQLPSSQRIQGLELSSSIVRSPNVEGHGRSICPKSANKIKFMLVNNAEQFFATNENQRPTPIVPDTNELQSSYLQFLNAQAPPMNVYQQQQPQQQQPQQQQFSQPYSPYGQPLLSDQPNFSPASTLDFSQVGTPATNLSFDY